MRILDNNWKLFSKKEMVLEQENLPENHGWKTTKFDKDFYIIPPNFYEDLKSEKNHCLSFNISDCDIETLAEDIANIQLDILFGNTAD